MRQTLSGVGALLILGLGLGFFRNQVELPAVRPASKPGPVPTRPRPEEEPNAKSVTSACNKPDCAAKDLLNTLDAFYSAGANRSVPEKGSPLATLKERINGLAARQKIHFEIAIVPDPIHTHLSLFTDRTMDAIQLGAQQGGWIFNQASLPWDSEEHPESTDFRLRLLQQSLQGEKEDLPGIMIFRPVSPDPADLSSSLLMFVVGETPTGGVNKNQFEAAVSVITSSHQMTKVLRIVGPTFSGSLYSLFQLLNRVPNNGTISRVVLRSGTISGWDSIHWFTQQKFANSLQVDFGTLQQTDAYMLSKFVAFEERRGYSARQIAVLTEDETAYGTVPSETRTAIEPAANSPSGGGKRVASPLSVDNETTNDEGQKVLRLYFPRNISQLRSAYQRGADQVTSAADGYQVRSTLPLNLQDTGSDDDTLPQYAHSQTPLSQESILLGIIAAIRKRHIQFVVLQATNPMDTLFLSAFLKKGYSDARVVALPADLLLGRDTDDISLLHGVMALTTYSLLPGISDEIATPEESTSKSKEPPSDHVFPSAYAAGTYNATLSQITCIAHETMPGCDGPQSPTGLPEAHYTEYGWPQVGGPIRGNSLSPVVWLTVLGRNGFWPVAVLEDGTRKQGEIESSIRPMLAQQPKKGARFKPPRPTFWAILSGSLFVLVGLYWLLLRRGTILSSSSAMSLLAPIKHPSRSAMIVVSCWILLTTLLLLAWPWVAWTSLKWEPIVSAAGIFLAAVILCLTGYVELKRRGSEKAATVLMIGSIVLVCSFAFMYAIGSHAQNAFLYRYIHLTSGVSPLLPFLYLLAAGLWWVWFSLVGLALIDKRRPRLPRSDGVPYDSPARHTAPEIRQIIQLGDRSAQVIERLAQPIAQDSRIYGPAFAILLAASLAVDYSHPILSLETGHYEWIYSGVLTVLTFVLFCTLFQLSLLWLECHKILLALDRFPVRRAFGELRFTWQPIWRFGGGRWQDLYRLVSRQTETLEHLRREVEAADGDEALLGCIKETAEKQNEIQREFATLHHSQSGQWRRRLGIAEPETVRLFRDSPGLSDRFIGLYEDLQKRIANTCAAALRYLQPRWWEDEGFIESEVGTTEDSEQNDKDKPELPLVVRLTERFVALVYLNFILTVLLRIRTLALIAGGLYIFLLLSVNSYPFEPKIALRSLAILILICVVSVVGYVFAQIHRDSIISLVTQTRPGELGFQFWLRMASFVALPLMSLLLSQFPTLNNMVFSWLEPAANALK